MDKRICFPPALSVLLGAEYSVVHAYSGGDSIRFGRAALLRPRQIIELSPAGHNHSLADLRFPAVTSINKRLLTYDP